MSKRIESIHAAKRYIGARVSATISETGQHVDGIFIGFWNPEFVDRNSQTTPARYAVPFPFNILTRKGVRIAVDSFCV